MKDPDHPEPSPDLRRFLLSAKKTVGLAGEVNVRIVADSEMRRLNREFRGKDKTTDVLSFPTHQNGTALHRPAGPRLYSGDIAVCSNIARANAESLGHSFEDELKILLLHGLLHLAGHDHESDNGEMAVIEEKLRAKLKLPTALIERSKGGRPGLPVGGRRTSSPPAKTHSDKRGFSPGLSRRPALKRKIKTNRLSGALKRSSPRINAGASTRKSGTRKDARASSQIKSVRRSS